MVPIADAPSPMSSSAPELGPVFLQGVYLSGRERLEPLAAVPVCSLVAFLAAVIFCWVRV